MTGQLQRAQMLISQSRYEMAEQELGQALAAAPNDPQVHTLMALCLLARDKKREATEFAEKAVGLAPDSDFAHSVLARVWQQRNYLDRAAEAADEAIRLDPDDPDNYTLLGCIRLDQKRWAEARDCANEALAIDPEETDALNLRAAALRQLGEKVTAADELHTALQVDPDDADTHANLGWNFLVQGNRVKANEHFREALRLNPDSEWAQQGLIESIKTHNILYRWIFNYFVWISKFSAGKQWLIVIGAYLVYRFVRQMAAANPQLAPVLWPILGIYIGFVISTWLAVPLSNLALRLHPLGRLALSREESIGANLVGVSLLLVIVLGVLALLYPESRFEFGVLWMLNLPITISIALTFTVQKGRPRMVMGLYTAAVVAAGLFLAFAVLTFDPLSQTAPLLASAINQFGLLLEKFYYWSALAAVILANFVGTWSWKE